MPDLCQSSVPQNLIIFSQDTCRNTGLLKLDQMKEVIWSLEVSTTCFLFVCVLGCNARCNQKNVFYHLLYLFHNASFFQEISSVSGPLGLTA